MAGGYDDTIFLRHHHMKIAMMVMRMVMVVMMTTRMITRKIIPNPFPHRPWPWIIMKMLGANIIMRGIILAIGILGSNILHLITAHPRIIQTGIHILISILQCLPHHQQHHQQQHCITVVPSPGGKRGWYNVPHLYSMESVSKWSYCAC